MLHWQVESASSYYIEESNKQTRRRKFAFFFVESGEHEAACVKALFLDFLGLRKLAVDKGVSPAVINIGLTELLKLENGANIKK